MSRFAFTFAFRKQKLFHDTTQTQRMRWRNATQRVFCINWKLIQKLCGNRTESAFHVIFIIFFSSSFLFTFIWWRWLQYKEKKLIFFIFSILYFLSWNLLRLQANTDITQYYAICNLFLSEMRDPNQKKMKGKEMVWLRKGAFWWCEL